MLSRASRPGGTRSKSCAGLLFWGEGERQLRKVPALWSSSSSPGWRQGAGGWVGVTHREAQFAELAGTQGTATVSAQPGAHGLPLRLKGSLAQGLQLLPLFLGSLLGVMAKLKIQGQTRASPSLMHAQGTYLTVGVQWCPHAWLQQPQHQGLQYVQVVSHLVAQWRCTVDDVLKDNPSTAVSVGLQGEEWGGVCQVWSFLPCR